MREQKTKTYKIDSKFKERIQKSRGEFFEEKTFSTGDVVEVIVEGNTNASSRHHVGIVLDPYTYWLTIPNIAILEGTKIEQYHPVWVYLI